MAVTHPASIEELRAIRPLGTTDSWELLERLKVAYSKDEPFDPSVVFELAERAIEVEHPEANANTYIEDGRVVHVF